MKQFLNKLLSTSETFSSNRFIAVFIFSPLLVYTVVARYDMEYVYSVIGLISSLLVINMVPKLKNGVK